MRYFSQPIFRIFSYLKNALHNLVIELCSALFFSKFFYSYILTSRTVLKCTQMRARVEKVDVLGWNKSKLASAESPPFLSSLSRFCRCRRCYRLFFAIFAIAHDQRVLIKFLQTHPRIIITIAYKSGHIQIFASVIMTYP